MSKRPGIHRPPPFVIEQGHRYDLECVYDFPDEFGTIQFIKVRFRLVDVVEDPDVRTKTFRYYPAGRKRDGLLYRLPAVLAAVRGGARAIWWCEGEKDADVATAHGLVATSHHGGATKVWPAQCAWLTGYVGRVYVVADKDAPGYYDAAQRLDGLMRYASLRREQIRVVRTPALKDLADHYAAGYGRRDWRVINETWLRKQAAKHTPATAAAHGYGGVA